jgi:hypothetical protein
MALRHGTSDIRQWCPGSPPKHFTAKLAKTAKRVRICGSGLGPRMEIVRLAQTG